MAGFSKGRRLAFSIASLLAITGLPANAQQSIFKCVNNEGQTTFQETVCDDGVQTDYNYKNQDVSPSTSVDDSLINNLGTPTPVIRQSRNNRLQEIDDEPAGLSLKQQKQCDRWHDEMEDINAEQRRGYTAEEGEKYRRKLRRLKRNIERQACPRDRVLR